MSPESQWCNHPFKWIQNGWSNADLWLLFWLPSIKFSLVCPLNISQCFFCPPENSFPLPSVKSSHKPELKAGHVSHPLIPLPPILKSHQWHIQKVHPAPLCAGEADMQSGSGHSSWQRSIILRKPFNGIKTNYQLGHWLISCFSLPPGALKCRTESRKDFLENEERPSKVSKPGQVNKLSQLPRRNWLVLDKLTKGPEKTELF